VILVKASAGLVIEFALSEAGAWPVLSLRLANGIAAEPFRFEVAGTRTGRLLVRPLEARRAADLIVALGVVAGHEAEILAEVTKYHHPVA
jgi:hypothetical protein